MHVQPGDYFIDTGSEASWPVLSCYCPAGSTSLDNGPDLGFHQCPILIWQLLLNFTKEPPSWGPVWLLLSHAKYQKRIRICKKLRYQNPGEVSSAGALSPGPYPLLFSELPVRGRRGHTSQTLLHGWLSTQYQPSGWLLRIYFICSHIRLSKGECGKV